MTSSTEVSTVSKVDLNPMVEVEGFKLKKLSIITTFSDTKKIDKAIEKFRTEALSVVPDLTSKKGRDAIASFAFKISKKKTSIVSQMIDPSIKEAKTLVKNVNGGKSYFQEKMDALRDEVRKPLNDWEKIEAEKELKRIDDIKEKIVGISAIATFEPANQPCKDEISSLLEAVDSINCDEGFSEFTQDALQAKARAKEILTEMLNSIIQKELKEVADEELRLKELELVQQLLKQKAQERLNNLMMIPVGFIGKSSFDIKVKINSLEKYEVKEDEFGELFEQANSAKIQVIQQLNTMHDHQIIIDNSKEVKEVVTPPTIKTSLNDLINKGNETIESPINVGNNSSNEKTSIASIANEFIDKSYRKNLNTFDEKQVMEYFFGDEGMCDLCTDENENEYVVEVIVRRVSVIN